MIDIKQFTFNVITRKGEQTLIIRAFNKPQAKRKLMQQFSAKHDCPVIKSVARA